MVRNPALTAAVQVEMTVAELHARWEQQRVMYHQLPRATPTDHVLTVRKAAWLF